ncbi:MAG: c-type cytochrome [Deltaproteobacteria bacterium]|nr:c-type cytochrome [Deltaproteobacteria bacterium]
MIDAWIDAFYRLLNQIGFPDPLHAALVHMPIGLVMGAALFGWLALLPGRERFQITARNCAVLAFLFWFPTALFGYMDWRHFYHGASLNPITMKLLLAGLLLILLAGALFFAFRRPLLARKVTPVIYTLCLITAVLLGWFGARLVYGGKTGAEGKPAYALGEKIFVAHCRECHPGGGNIMEPDEPLVGSDKLQSPETFIALLRQPKAPMPAFPPAALTDADARELYRYITNVLAQSGR